MCSVWVVEVDSASVIAVSEEEKKKHTVERLTCDDFLVKSKNETTCYFVREVKKIPQKSRKKIDKYNEYNPLPEDKKIPHLIPEEELPVLLPLDLENYKPTGKSPLEDHPTFPVYVPQNKQVPFQKWTW